MIDDLDLAFEAGSRVGTVLCGKYRLDAVLGVGGMATVYAATHRNRAELAVKVLHRELALDPVVRARFLREAYAVNSIRHRGIVKIVDDDVTEDGAAFLVMDRLEGHTADDLRDRCGGAVPVQAAVAIVEQLLDTLGAAHARGVVHRDVKPANLFVTRDGDVKVLDFGIAHTREARGAGLALTGAASILGTPTFMAPEQALPGMTEIDARTDVWAAGASLFYLLSGRTVHEGDTAGEVVVKAAMNPAMHLADAMPAAPRAIAEVVDVALGFEKGARWATALDMRAALLAAHRLHFGGGPTRSSLARLVGPPASGVAYVGQPYPRALASLAGAPVGAIPRRSAEPSPAPASTGPQPGSRTSIPVARSMDVSLTGGTRSKAGTWYRMAVSSRIQVAACALAAALGVVAWIARRPSPAPPAPARENIAVVPEAPAPLPPVTLLELDGAAGAYPVDFQSGPYKLHGDVFKPSGSGPFPVVVYNHGSEREPGLDTFRDIGRFFQSAGYVVFFPYRRGTVGSEGPYWRDTVEGADADEHELTVRALEAESDDVLEAIRWVRAQRFVDPSHVALAGCSFGGIETVLGAERSPDVYAAVDFAGASMSWKGSVPLQDRMKRAVRGARAPIFFVQAKNDFNIEPSLTLSDEMTSAGKPNAVKIFPPFGATAGAGHGGFCTMDMGDWGKDVLAFLRDPHGFHASE